MDNTCTTFIEELGKTGSNLIDQEQNLYVLVAVSIPKEQEDFVRGELRRIFNEGKDADEKEFKAINWIKNEKKSRLLDLLIDKMFEIGCEINFVLTEKKPDSETHDTLEKLVAEYCKTNEYTTSYVSASDDSGDEILLQTADIMATSLLDTLECLAKGDEPKGMQLYVTMIAAMQMAYDKGIFDVSEDCANIILTNPLFGSTHSYCFYGTCG